MTDFKRALRNGLLSSTPKAQITSCWFHFYQANKRKTYKLGMKETLKSNDKARIAYLELLALPFLPTAEIVLAFEVIKARVSQEQIPNIYAFSRYFSRTRRYYCPAVLEACYIQENKNLRQSDEFQFDSRATQSAFMTTINTNFFLLICKFHVRISKSSCKIFS